MEVVVISLLKLQMSIIIQREAIRSLSKTR